MRSIHRMFRFTTAEWEKIYSACVEGHRIPSDSPLRQRLIDIAANISKMNNLQYRGMIASEEEFPFQEEDDE